MNLTGAACSRRFPSWPITHAFAVCGPVERSLNVATSCCWSAGTICDLPPSIEISYAFGGNVQKSPETAVTLTGTALQASADSVSPSTGAEIRKPGVVHVHAPRKTAATAISASPARRAGVPGEVAFTSILLSQGSWSGPASRR